MSDTWSYYAGERRAALKRDNFTCQYCGDKPNHPTADHVHPKSKGGSDHRHNLVCACEQCNRRKGHLSLAEWYVQLSALSGPDRRPAERFYASAVMTNIEQRIGHRTLQGQLAHALAFVARPSRQEHHSI